MYIMYNSLCKFTNRFDKCIIMKMGVEVLLKHKLLSDIHQLSDYFILQWDSVPARHIICDMMTLRCETV